LKALEALVGKSRDKLTNDLIGVAGVHFVAFRLSLRGLIVLPTIRNTAGIDLLVNNPLNGSQASLQVKTSINRVRFWPTSTPEKCLRGARTYYVFLRYDAKVESFEAFLQDGEEVAKQVTWNAEDYLKRDRKAFSFWQLPRSEEEIEQLRQNWHEWMPPAE
jgi:hypothetical protein